MRHVFSDSMISLGAVLVLLLTLVSVDPRLRDRVSGLWGAPSSSFSSMSTQVRHVSTVAYSAARDQSVANAPLAIFSVVAVVLLLFMLRT
jgi:hypothetical protein